MTKKEKNNIIFRASGQSVKFPGFLRVYVDSDEEAESVAEKFLPNLDEGDVLDCKKMEAVPHETVPPGRYTEATLVKKLESEGIGRPSTYASVVSTIQDRQYVEKEGKALHPTDVGEVVTELLEKHFDNIVDYQFTAKMEGELDEVAMGKKKYEEVLREFWGPFHANVEKKTEELSKQETTNLGKGEFPCPKCGGETVIKLGRTGKFLSCAKYPECSGATSMEGENMAPKETGETCPKCEKNPLVERIGRFGKFVSCSGYPKCKFIKKDAKIEGEPDMGTGINCPQCKKNEIVMKKGRFGPFFSCSGYPDCKFIIKYRPTGKNCELCGSLMMEGTNAPRCSNKVCEKFKPVRKKKV